MNDPRTGLPPGKSRMWEATLCHDERGNIGDVECVADTLLEAVEIMSRQLQPHQYLLDVSCRGWCDK